MARQAALLQHLFTRVLPVPDPSHPDCFWHTPMKYAKQLDTLVLTRRLVVRPLPTPDAVSRADLLITLIPARGGPLVPSWLQEHFVSSSFAINLNREFDGVKMCVAAVAAGASSPGHIAALGLTIDGSLC
jgi:hypothetical protein